MVQGRQMRKPQKVGVVFKIRRNGHLVRDSAALKYTMRTFFTLLLAMVMYCVYWILEFSTSKKRS